jgi:hypothetical protein
MNTIKVNGVETQVPEGAIAYKYADPTEGARWVYEQDDLDEIRSADPSLLVVVPEIVIKVLGTGSEFDLPDEAQQDTDMEWYGTVEVEIGGVVYQVGAVIGVPESERGTCRAAGAGVRPHLTAWYADGSDWSCAPASGGGAGLPQALASDVIAAIAANARRLWAEAR